MSRRINYKFITERTEGKLKALLEEIKTNDVPQLFITGEINEMLGFIYGYIMGDKNKEMVRTCAECGAELKHYEDEECLNCMNIKYKH